MDTSDHKIRGPKIAIVGPNTMQNRLMVSFLQLNLQMDSVEYSSQSLEEIYEKEEPTALFLFDAQAIGLSVLTRYLSMDTVKAASSSNSHAVIYNVDPCEITQEQHLDCALHGVFYMDEPLKNIGQGIESILEGHHPNAAKTISEYISDRKTAITLKGELSEELTAREKEVLAKIHSGNSNKTIAEDMGISFHTVKCHVYNIFRKIGVSNRHRASLWAAHNL